MVTLYIYLSYVTTRKGVSLLKKELATKRARGAGEAMPVLTPLLLSLLEHNATMGTMP